MIYLIYTECPQIYLIKDPRDSEVRRRLTLAFPVPTRLVC